MTRRQDETFVAAGAGDHQILDGAIEAVPGGATPTPELAEDEATPGQAERSPTDDAPTDDVATDDTPRDATSTGDAATVEPPANDPQDDPARDAGTRTRPGVGPALARAASWARALVPTRGRGAGRPDPLARAVAELPEAGPELLVALDIDGTILHHDTTLAPRVAESVAALQETGTHVMLATGRAVFATVPVADQLGLRSRYAVSSNGAVTVRLEDDADGGFEVDHVVTFDPEPALRALRRTIPDGVFAVEDVGVGFRLSSPFPPGELSGEWELVDFEDLCSREVTRLTVRAAHLDSATFHEAVHSAGMQSVTYAIGWSSWVDVAPEGISKATALERVRELLGVAPTATVTAGDGSNDVEMLAWAQLGVAMGGARPEVRAHARAAVPTVEQDGLADLLDLLAAPR